MAYTKQTWNDDDIITKEKMNNIEEGIANIELTPGPKGDKGDTGATGPQGPAGTNGKDAVIQKLNNITALTSESATTQEIATAFNNLISDLKAKEYMNQS